MTQQDTPLVLWSTDDYLKQVELNRMLQQAGAFVVDERAMKPLAIMVRATEDIAPNHTGECLVLKGTYGAWNATPDPLNPDNDFTLDVYNQSDEEIKDGDEFMAQWSTTRGGLGNRSGSKADGWVSAHIGGAKTKEVRRAYAREDIAKGEKGEIDVVGDGQQIGIWEHCTSGFDLLSGNELWVWGPVDDGEWEIIGIDCRWIEGTPE